MFAVFKTGGKQYKAAVGDILRIELIKNVEQGADFDLTEVLMVGNDADVKIGTPVVENAKVTATVLQHAKDKKVRIFKMRRRKHYKKSQGHRQNLTHIKIKEITA